METMPKFQIRVKTTGFEIYEVKAATLQKAIEKVENGEVEYVSADHIDTFEVQPYWSKVFDEKTKTWGGKVVSQ